MSVLIADWPIYELPLWHLTPTFMNHFKASSFNQLRIATSAIPIRFWIQINCSEDTIISTLPVIRFFVLLFDVALIPKITIDAKVF